MTLAKSDFQTAGQYASRSLDRGLGRRISRRLEEEFVRGCRAQPLVPINRLEKKLGDALSAASKLLEDCANKSPLKSIAEELTRQRMECGERFAALPYLERKAAKRSPHSIRFAIPGA